MYIVLLLGTKLSLQVRGKWGVLFLARYIKRVYSCSYILLLVYINTNNNNYVEGKIV